MRYHKGLLERFLEQVAKLQYSHGTFILILVIVFTAFMFVGVTKVRMESDFNKEMPQQLPIFQLNNRISDKLGGQDTIILLFSIDDELNFKGAPRDIRDPDIVDYLIVLEEELIKEPALETVTSPGTFFADIPYTTLDDVKSTIAAVDSLSSFYSSDYRHTVMFITTDLGRATEATKEVTKLIEDKIDGLSKPSGVKVTITGGPPLGATILHYLQQDAMYTISLAAMIILVLLIILQWSIRKGLVIFTPLALGVVWTMGTLGWVNIKLSVATVGIGAMILGLGVEYGVFMLTRYMEERDKGKSQSRALRVAVPGVGSAVLGSGTTTIIGFMALTLSFMPMLQHLGFSLALGIIYCLLSAVLVEPVIIVMSAKYEHWQDMKKHSKLIGRIERRRLLDR